MQKINMICMRNFFLVFLISFQMNSFARSLSKQNETPQFPELSCLKENVTFWERVYSEIDYDQAFVHDKYKLGRIYSIVSIPSNNRLKEIKFKNKKKIIQDKILSLAKKIKTHQQLNFNEKRLAKLFTKEELNESSLIEAASHIRIQVGLKSQFKSGVRRSINYMPIIFPMVKKSGLHLDLAYLPHVESSYNSRAGSKVGALGLWQLMPSTMRNLEGNNAVYQRTDPRISTKAALKLLKMNFEKTGSWPLALTAYNHGANGVLRAMEETNSNNLCTIIENYNSPSFKFASSNFYAQFLAARNIASKKYKLFANKTNNVNVEKNLLLATAGVY